MIPRGSLSQMLRSTVARKLITGLSGLGVLGFVVTHLLENLLLYRPDAPAAYNTYVAWLHSWGGLLKIAELGLASLFLIHIVNSLWLQKENRAARPLGYHHPLRSKGGESLSNISSRHMAITGTVLLAFLVLHLVQFRFGPGVAEGYATEIRGQPELDLYRLVAEVFRQPLYVGLYAGAMIFLGLHVRHGFWSAFQTLGAMSPRLTHVIHFLGLVLALLLAFGFIGIPFWIYFGGSAWIATGVAGGAG